MASLPLLGILLVASVTGCGAQLGVVEAEKGEPGRPAAVDRGRSAPSSGIRQPPGLDRAVAALDRLGKRRFPANFTSVQLGEQQSRVVIYRTTAGRLDEVVRQRYPELPITFRDAPFSFTEMQTGVSAVLRDEAYWTARGVQIASVGPDPERGVVVSTSPAIDTGPAFAERYGDIVTVEEPTGSPIHPGPYTPSG